MWWWWWWCCYLYITSQNFKNAIVFQVSFRLVVNWGGAWFQYVVHFLEYFDNEKCLRAEVFCLFIILPLTFSQAKVCWNKLNTLHTQIRIWHLGVSTMQTLINIALSVLIIFKVVKYGTFPRTFDTKQACYKVKGNNGHVHRINLPNYRKGFSKNSVHFCGQLFL